jgi:hypothetical protein
MSNEDDVARLVRRHFNPRSGSMSKVEAGQTARVLQDEELDAVNGGFHDVEAVAYQAWFRDSWFHEVEKVVAKR